MAHDVLIAGALFPDVPSVQFPDSQQQWHSFTDVSDTTAAAADVASGKQFYDASGTLTQGTASGGGGGSSYTLIGSKEFTVNTTSTSAAEVGTFECDPDDLWTSTKIIVVQVRDKLGPRNGYFTGTDSYFTQTVTINNQATTAITYRLTRMMSIDSSGNYFEDRVSGTTVYGVYCSKIAKSGVVTISSRYNTNLRTINSTYVVKVFALDWPSGDAPRP